MGTENLDPLDQPVQQDQLAQTSQPDPLNQLVVDNLVTWRCNLRCKKCCVPKEGFEAKASEFAESFDKLYQAGLRRIVLTGGDPLVRDDIGDIAQSAKERGFEVYLSTNGVLLKERWEELAQSISWISLSLDESTAESNENMTGKGGANQFKKILEFLEYYENSDQKTAKIKLATVITKKNKDDLMELGKLIYEGQPGYRPDIWRLYQFSNQFSAESDVGYEYVTENSVTSEEAEQVIKELRAAFPQVEISYRPAESRDESFIFVSPDLTLTYPSGTKYVPFGNTGTMSSAEIREAMYGVRRIWDKIIGNRAIYK